VKYHCPFGLIEFPNGRWCSSRWPCWPRAGFSRRTYHPRRCRGERLLRSEHGRFQKLIRGALAAEGPLFGPVIGREIVGPAPGQALDAVDGKGMVDGHDEPAAGGQHAPQLGQRRRPVLQVVQHQGRDDIVERAVGERQRAAQVGHVQVRVGAEPPPGQLQHLGAGVDAGHDGAPVAQRREQGAGAAAGVEDSPAGHVPGQGQDRGPRVIGIYEVGLSFGRVCLGEAVIVVGHGRIRGPSRSLGNGRHAVHPGIAGLSRIGCRRTGRPAPCLARACSPAVLSLVSPRREGG
jgi:hypothetical protein